MFHIIKSTRLAESGSEIIEFHHAEDFDELAHSMISKYPNSLIEIRFTK